MKQLEVHIMGQSYVLGAPVDGEDRLQQAVARVDAAMCKIRDAGKVKARDRIAVLTALNLAFDLADRNATTTTSADATASSNNESFDDSTLRSLIERLDLALGNDGRLI
ncbi:MAG: cell division protein ZapA [Burkholderiaceae bacterium]